MTSQDRQQDGIEEERLSALYRATRREMPSSRLDQEILDQAARVARNRRRRWLLPLSTAAVILLGTSLTLTLVQPPLSTSSPEMEEDALSSDAMEAPKMAPSAPLKRGKMALPEATKPAPAPQGAVPHAVVVGEDRAVLMQEGILERRMQALPLSSKTKESDELASERSAAEWVDQMLSLQQAGERDALLEALKAFRRDYPDYPLPQALAEIETP